MQVVTKKITEFQGRSRFLEYRKGESGIRVGGTFIGFLKPGDRMDIIVAVPWGGRMVPGSKKGKCDRCGGDIALAPSTQQVMKEYPDLPTRCINCVQAEL